MGKGELRKQEVQKEQDRSVDTVKYLYIYIYIYITKGNNTLISILTFFLISPLIFDLKLKLNFNFSFL